MTRFERSGFRIEDIILFGRYRVLSTLGSGSFSTVYLAEHLKLKVYRAVKCIPKDAAYESSFSSEDGFPTEVNLLKNLNHPGIPLIYDIDEDEQFIYIFEEFIQGESLEEFILHQENISQELILNIGIQLCDILDYLHNLSPYPILYQDLKPEHIILCGNQLKLIDFGIASFFTGSGKHFQLFGTDGFAAPEALEGLPTTPSADIYSLGRILEFLASYARPACPPSVLHIFQQAAAYHISERYESAASLKSALTGAQNTTCSHSSHLIRNIAVIGSRTGAGATHFSIALVSILNKKGLPAIYRPAASSDILADMAASNHHLKERGGIFYYEYFHGIPNYGAGIECLIPPDCCLVTDYETCPTQPEDLSDADLIFFIMSGSDWDIAHASVLGKHLNFLEQVVYVCNYHNKKAARKYARLFGKKVFCYPCDPDPYHISAEKERLISAIFHRKGGITDIRF